MILCIAVKSNFMRFPSPLPLTKYQDILLGVRSRACKYFRAISMPMRTFPAIVVVYQERAADRLSRGGIRCVKAKARLDDAVWSGERANIRDWEKVSCSRLAAYFFSAGFKCKVRGRIQLTFSPLFGFPAILLAVTCNIWGLGSVRLSPRDFSLSCPAKLIYHFVFIMRRYYG